MSNRGRRTGFYKMHSLGNDFLVLDRVTDGERAAEAWILGLRLDEGITAAEAAARSATVCSVLSPSGPSTCSSAQADPSSSSFRSRGIETV